MTAGSTRPTEDMGRNAILHNQLSSDVEKCPKSMRSETYSDAKSTPRELQIDFLNRAQHRQQRTRLRDTIEGMICGDKQRNVEQGIHARVRNLSHGQLFKQNVSISWYEVLYLMKHFPVQKCGTSIQWSYCKSFHEWSTLTEITGRWSLHYICWYQMMKIYLCRRSIDWWGIIPPYNLREMESVKEYC